MREAEAQNNQSGVQWEMSMSRSGLQKADDDEILIAVGIISSMNSRDENVGI